MVWTILHFSVYKACFTFQNVDIIILCNAYVNVGVGRHQLYLNTLHDVRCATSGDLLQEELLLVVHYIL